MSKAFVRESDHPDVPDLQPSALLPPGARNYLTAAGEQRLRAELARLVERERPALVSAAEDPEKRQELRMLDQRIRYLNQSLQSAEIVHPVEGPPDRVRFGTCVTVRDPEGTESTYRIVGVDETDASRGSISWISPLARALLSSRTGEKISFDSPAGERVLEVVRISHE